MSRFRIVDFGGGERLRIAVPSAGDQHPPVIQQGRGVAVTGRGHIAGAGESVGHGIEQFRGAIAVTAGDQHATVAQAEKVHLFVFTLGYSRRLYAHAYRHERLSSLLDGNERAFRQFGGVTLTCPYDNPRTRVLGRRENKVLWHPQFEDFARYYGFTPRACQPYRARTKGKVENGVKYVTRNALAGRRFRRFTHEQLTPLGTRRPIIMNECKRAGSPTMPW